MLLFPIVLILILGTALSTMFNPSTIGKTNVAYLNLDAGTASESFDGFLKLEEIEDLLIVKYVNTYDEGLEMIKTREVAAMIFIDEAYTEGLQKNEKGDIKVIRSNYSSFGAIIVNSVVEGFVNAANAIEATASLGSFNSQFIREKSINRRPISSSGRVPTAMDYYSVTMLAMTIMYGASYGIHEIGKDYFDSIGGRIKASPTKAYEMYVGKTLGVVITLFTQSLMLILFTRYVFNVNWGNNLWLVLFICFSLTMLSTGIGVMLCMVCSSRRKASSIMNILVPFFTFIAGGYIPIDNIGGMLDKIKFLSPNYLAQRAIFNQVFEGGSGETQLFIMIIWGMGLFTFMASAIAGRRQIQ